MYVDIAFSLVSSVIEISTYILGIKAFWGNGDGRFIYPPLAAATPSKSGGKTVIAPPVPSIRWEMLREGIEDYEYLWLLRDLLAKQASKLDQQQLSAMNDLLDVPASITESMTEFTTDSAPIYERRARIAAAIELLQAMDSR